MGNMVWLSTKNIKTERLSKKLDYKRISSYKIKELVRLFYQLDLPISMRIYDVFHPNLLQLVTNNPLPGQHNKPEPSVVVNRKKKWEVDNILDVKYD